MTNLLLLLLSRFSHVRLCATPQMAAHWAPLSMGLSRQEYWSGLPFPSPRDLPDPGIESRFPALQTDSLLSEPQGSKSSPSFDAFPGAFFHFVTTQTSTSGPDDDQFGSDLISLFLIFF